MLHSSRDAHESRCEVTARRAQWPAMKRGVAFCQAGYQRLPDGRLELAPPIYIEVC
jgi:hypothetical protein